jgi:hypothetical protein
MTTTEEMVGSWLVGIMVFGHKTKKGDSMAKRGKSNPAQLVQQLDKLTESMRPGEEVALCSPLGLIYSWQKHKLENLKFSLEHGEPAGFITVRESANNDLHVDLCLLRDDPEGNFHNVQNMIHSIEGVWEMCGDPGDSDEIDMDFRKEFKFCSECGKETN